MHLWAGQTISIFGSLISRTALPFAAILVLHATPVQMAILSAADLVPGFLFGLVAGVWVDRLRRRPILIAADIGRAVLLASIPLAAFFGRLHIEHLYLVAFLAGILTIFFDVAYVAFLPALVRREDLIEGNSKMAASASVAEVGAFGLAGWLVQWLTAPFAVLIDAVSFLASAALIGRIPAEAAAVSPGADTETPRSWREFVGEMAEGLHAIRENPLLQTLAASAVVLNFAFRIFGTMYMLFVTRTLGFRPGVLGMIFAVGGVTSLVSALLAGPITRRIGVGPAIATGLGLAAAGALFVPLAPGATLVGGLMLVMNQLVTDPGWSLYAINETSLQQAIVPDRMRGRVNATIRFASLGAMLLGTFAAGWLGQTIGLRRTLLVGTCAAFLAALIVLLSPLRTLREAPAP